MPKRYRNLARQLFRLLEEGEESEVEERLSQYSPHTLLGIVQYAAAVEKGNRKLARRLAEVERRLALDPKTELFRYDIFEQDLHENFSRRGFPFKRSEDREPVALIMGDIDDFKAVNSSYGHTSGDNILYQVAGHIVESVGNHGKVYRYGGEEITVLLPGLTRNDAFPIAERARKKIARHRFRVNKPPYEIPVTISFGVHHYPFTPQELKEIYKDREGLRAFYHTLKRAQKRKYRPLLESFNNGDKLSDLASDPLFQEFYRELMINMLVRGANDAMLASKNRGKNRTTVFAPEDLKSLGERK